MKAIIIDDEKRAQISLEMILKDYYPEVDLVASCTNLLDGIEAINTLNPEIVFLDIEMPENSGLEIGKFINLNDSNFDLIFTTAYEEHAIKAFKLNAVDYLLKPINPEELVATLDRIKKSKIISLETQEKKCKRIEKIAVPTSTSLLFIDTNEIIYIKGEGAYSDVIIKDKKNILVSKNLKNFEEIFSTDDRFIRVQKSYIVNFDYITSLSRTNGGSLHLINDLQIPIASDKFQLVLDKITILKK